MDFIEKKAIQSTQKAGEDISSLNQAKKLGGARSGVAMTHPNNTQNNPYSSNMTLLPAEEFSFFDKEFIEDFYASLPRHNVEPQQNKNDTCKKETLKEPSQDLSVFQIQQCHIKHQLYVHVLKFELQKIKRKFRHFQILPQSVSDQRLLLCFWLAIHNEINIVVKFLYERFDIIQILIEYLYEKAHQNKEKIMEELQEQKLYIQQTDQPELNLISQYLVSEQLTTPTAPEYFKRASKIKGSIDFLPQQVQETIKSKVDFLKSQQVSHAQSEEISPFMSDKEEKQLKEKIRNMKQLNQESTFKEIKILLMTSIGTDLCNELLKIALNDSEHRMAQIIAIYYKVNLSKPILYRSICDDNVGFLYLIFNSEKFHTTITTECTDQPPKIKKPDITLEQFIQTAISKHQDSMDLALSDDRIQSLIQRQKIAQSHQEKIDRLLTVMISEWNFPQSVSKDIIRMLLKHNLESLAWEREDVFFTFHMIYYSELKVWPQKKIDLMLKALMSITTSEYEKNLITSVHNPILAIALCCELLTKIMSYHKYAKNQCKATISKMKVLVAKIINHQDDLNILEKLLTELDFRKRSALHIIVELGLTEMICHPKVNTILEELWSGKENLKCNGQFSDFSVLNSRLFDNVDENNLLFTQDQFGRRILSNKVKFWNIVFGSFTKPEINEQKYWFQYNFRHRSIDYLFWKEFILSLTLVIIFQYISYSYLSYFKNSNIEINGWYKQDHYEDNDPELIKHVEVLIHEYKNEVKMGFVMCAAMYFHILQKIYLSILTKKHFKYDLWLQIDFITAIGNTVGLYITSSISARSILDKITKQNLDFYISGLLVVTWCRFFSFILVVNKVSKLLITLVTMLINTGSFLFIFICYMLIASNIFTMRYSQILPDQYGTFFQSIRSLFDVLAANYKYQDLGVFQRSYDAILMIHLVITRIFLLNYLVALLSTIYQFMLQEGEYKQLQMRYTFYAKYQSLFAEGIHYENDNTHHIDNIRADAAMHPPPLNLITLFFDVIAAPFFMKSSIDKKIQFRKFQSFTMFWFENIFFLVGFLGFDLLISPVVYVKVFISFIMKITKKRKVIWYALIWMFCGIFILIGLAFYDTYNLYRIFCNLQIKSKEKINQRLHKNQEILQLQINLLNEVLHSMCQLLDQKESQQQQKINQKYSSKLSIINDFQDKEQLIHKLQTIKKKIINPDQKNDLSYSIDNELIIINWLKLRKQRIQSSQQKVQKLFQKDGKREQEIQKTKTQNLSMRPSTIKVTPKKSMVTQRESSSAAIFGNKLMKQINEENNLNYRASTNSFRVGNRKISNVSRILSDNRKRRSSGPTSGKIHNRLIKRAFNSNFLSQKYSQSLFGGSNQEYENQDGEVFLKKYVAIDEVLIKIVENFLSRFNYVSKNQGHNQIHLKFSLETLPTKLSLDNYHIVQMINFIRVQMALVSFQNQDADQLFNYYDQRNKARVTQLSSQSNETNEITKEILTIGSGVRNKLVKLFKLKHGFKERELQRKQELLASMRTVNRPQKKQQFQSSNNTVYSQQTSLFPVVEESEFDVNNSEYQEQTKRRILDSAYDNNSYFSSQDKSKEELLSNGLRTYKTKSFQIDHSQLFSEDSQSNSSFTSFSDVVVEDTESNLSVTDKEND